MGGMSMKVNRRGLFKLGAAAAIAAIVGVESSPEPQWIVGPWRVHERSAFRSWHGAWTQTGPNSWSAPIRFEMVLEA